MHVADSARMLHGHWVEAQNQFRVIVGNLFENPEFTLPRFCRWHQVGNLHVETFLSAVGHEINFPRPEFSDRNGIATPHEFLVDERFQHPVDRILPVAKHGMPEPNVAWEILFIDLEVSLAAEVIAAHPVEHESITQKAHVTLHGVDRDREPLAFQVIGDTFRGKELPCVVKSEPADVLKKRDVPHLVAGPP